MHYSNKSYETEWSFLNHKKGNKNLRLKDTYTSVIEKLRIKRGIGLNTDEFYNFRYEHLWNHDFFAQESNIIFDIFDIFFDIFSILFRYFFRCFRCFFRYFSSIKSQFYILSYLMC